MPRLAATAVLTAVLTALLAAGLPPAVRADEPVSLKESFQPGERYSVSLRVDLDGRLSVPVEKETTPRLLTLVGTSALRYDERVLPADDPEASRVVRKYQAVDIRRTVADREQKADVRPEVRRMVVLRSARAKVPFSPDGPLIWDEIDVVRTDVFCPVLVPGLLPARPVNVGDHWLATASAVVDLTDMDTLDEGGFTVTFAAVATLNGKRMAKLTVAGTVKGVDENGPCRHRLDGTGYFDLESRRLTYLSVKGSKELLDQNGKPAGRVDGRFVMERGPSEAADLGDEALAKLELKPTADNTLLRYDNPALGVKFLYPRRWRVGAVQGNQLTLDGPNGAGLLLTAEPTDKTPTPAAYQAEVRKTLAELKADVPAWPAAADRFGLDAELKGEKLRLEYAVVQKPAGGLLLAARLPRADAGVLGKDVERLLASLERTAAAK